MKEDIRAAIARRNGALSKGPVSPEGRASSSLNALKHGLASRNPKTLCLQNEDPALLDAFTARWIAKLQPRDEAELEMVHEIVAHRWRLVRSWTIETATIDTEMDRQAATLNAKARRIDEPVRLAEAYKTLAVSSPALGNVGRYEFRLRRQFEHALRDYQFLRKLPGGMPDIPEDELGPKLVA